MSRLSFLIHRANKRGLRVNNLFQCKGGWRANLTDGETYHEFGEGLTPEAALAQALRKAKDG